jgi:YHS domain-containing protein
MTGWILRAILFFIVIRLIWRFLAGLIDGLTPGGARSRDAGSGQGGRAARDGKPASVPLVRDPVCGKYIVQSRALTGGRGDQVQYFCSEQCRDEFARRRA